MGEGEGADRGVGKRDRGGEAANEGSVRRAAAVAAGKHQGLPLNTCPTQGARELGYLYTFSGKSLSREKKKKKERNVIIVIGSHKLK